MTGYLAIGFGGFLGAMARYAFSKLINERYGLLSFPLGTVSVNIIGSFCLSLFLAFAFKKTEVNRAFYLFFATGFLGAFTTFSTFAYEGLKLLQEQSFSAFSSYFLLNIFGGFTAAFLGFVVGRAL
ncbi:MAG: fluoride efflux transporter CrcB [Thermotogae bacterium]|uniref:Fluoride-specific ion channel FluC n=1 Tax=Kosmotoga arenicorallina TaxID=688066 RepID=A0A7C5I0T2_9BACT|nr:fluoride efflux transporter CrcB [Kosmotoga sp.]MBO8165628.1 fluoride efflux transporter CrcB [Kosmotoga sp.]MCD6159886.1 fluoride efflux transporter CrcB [Kosmotoga sp.]RKX49695.1 MAG: fluoride efflux transporter CrcB [Thermotogota bacterium]HHF08390.1 fluoride efflux transporter CrcB [Kosmotoga arenicorallina]